MRHWRRDQRGLAEIVGTLMLVVIVVAAATAFSFFVAAEEKVTLAEQSARQLTGLENLSVGTLNEDTSLGLLSFDIQSRDVNPIYVNAITVNGDPVENYALGNGTHAAFFSNVNGTITILPSGTLELPPFSVTVFYVETFLLTLSKLAPAIVDLSTDRGNTFVETFLQPVAEIEISELTGYPVLDASSSYQPAGSSGSVTLIVAWSWVVTNLNLSSQNQSQDPDDGQYFNQAVDLYAPFIHDDDYAIELTVTNSDGLSGSAEVAYPG